ncbi:MAG: GNAT family N-acetyltransferase [Pseudomonadota bacterium]
MRNVTISDAGNIDPSRLAEIRVEAMRPSLEAIGRFDPERARARFLDTYSARETYILRAGGDLAGFYVLRERPDHLYLDHIYICPAHQGAGLGRGIVRRVQDQARGAGLPVRLMALRGSPAQDFYAACGFVPEWSDDLDTHYLWVPA